MEERQKRPKHSTPATERSNGSNENTRSVNLFCVLACFSCCVILQQHCLPTSSSRLDERNTMISSGNQYSNGDGPAPRQLSRPKSRAPTVSQEKLLWAKMASTKILAQNSNIAKRMGKMEELEKAMALLDKMRPSIGEAEYGTRVQHVLAAFPAFDTYDATVNAPIVIDLVDDNNGPRDDDDDDECVTMVSSAGRHRTTIPGKTLAYETPTRPSDDDDVSVEDDPADLHHVVVCQGNPIERMVFPDDSDDDHDDRTPGPVVSLANRRDQQTFPFNHYYSSLLLLVLLSSLRWIFLQTRMTKNSNSQY